MVVQSVVNSIMSSMTYVLSEEGYDYVWLVDCGDVDKIQNAIGNKHVKGILLTHAHYDHIFGIPRLIDLFPDCMVFSNITGIEALKSSKKNLSLYNEDPIVVDGFKGRVINEGDTIPIFEKVYASVIGTPGHCNSCLCYVINDCLFTGDAYIPGIPVVTNLPEGDKRIALESKKRIESLLCNLNIKPGHYCTNDNGKKENSLGDF